MTVKHFLGMNVYVCDCFMAMLVDAIAYRGGRGGHEGRVVVVQEHGHGLPHHAKGCPEEQVARPLLGVHTRFNDTHKHTYTNAM